jgi:hypothetical protein
MQWMRTFSKTLNIDMLEWILAECPISEKQQINTIGMAIDPVQDVNFVFVADDTKRGFK